MSLTKDEFERLDEAVRTLEEILGDLTLTGVISLVAGLKALGPEYSQEILEKLEEIESSGEGGDDD